MSAMPAGEATPQKVENAVRTEIEWLMDRHDRAPDLEMRKFTIKPSGSIPKHHRPDMEHEQYVLKGRYSVGLGDRIYEVREGDSIYIPSGTAHWYENTGNENEEFLCTVPKKEKYDLVYVEANSQPK